VEEAFMKPVPVGDEPSQQRIGASRRSHMTTETGSGESRTDMHHVEMAESWTSSKTSPSIHQPSTQTIKQRECHRSTFKGKAAELALDLIEPWGQILLILGREGSLVSNQQGASDSFKVIANAVVVTRESSMGELNLPG
jgi:hypothetical protein